MNSYGFRKRSSILMKVKTVDLMKRLDRLDGSETESMIKANKSGLLDLIEESFIAKEDIKNLDFDYIMSKRKFIFIKGSDND